MSQELDRISLTLPPEMVDHLDRIIEDWDYSSRSEAVRDALRDLFAAYDWETEEGGVHHGTITLAHDHHENDIADHLQSVQHDRTGIITATQHIHISHDQCLETITVNGPRKEISELANELRSIDGVSQVKVVVVGS
ncbi:nickel-responsive transcriptional regulator NikR [Halodesulfurarchaeum sp.]|uniref:nickel-responsive transcriptional regulator NikR n=1 Tax=Halodesulfurarchaeum sp. TaxID=1980530 RepID=UPI002FC3095E